MELRLPSLATRAAPPRILPVFSLAFPLPQYQNPNPNQCLLFLFFIIVSAFELQYSYVRSLVDVMFDVSIKECMHIWRYIYIWNNLINCSLACLVSCCRICSHLYMNYINFVLWKYMHVFLSTVSYDPLAPYNYNFFVNLVIERLQQ